ncbi:MAG: pantoate--beta-alanine ligase [Rhodospirillales bacterium]|nr:pantoate--beta-alanine ligase [Rhodospirillales bacterium]
MSLAVYKTRADLQAQVAAWKAQGHRVAFVPTMGALHAGHLSLMRLAKEKADKVVVSIFVNPTQFAPHEDFDTYPRDLDGDVKLLSSVGVDAVYAPSEADLYPEGAKSDQEAGAAAAGLESAFRPHFFDGVVTVVYRLFKAVQPDVAVFGEKDFQQLQVIREMVADKGLGIEIIGGPIARDEFGLALSSRNAYLSEGELEIARMLNQVIFNVAQGPSEERLAEAEEMILQAGFDKVDYVAYRPEWKRVLVAAWLGKTRLIDNCSAQ